MRNNSYPIWFVLMIVLHRCSSMDGPTPQEPDFPLPEELRYPLPETVIPERYKVIIEHYVDAPIPYYSGEVSIKIRCSTPTNSIILHKAGGIKIKTINVTLLSNADDNQFKIVNENHLAGNRWELVLDETLEENEKYEVYIKFYCNFYIHTSIYDTHGYILKLYGADSNQKIMTFTKLNEFDARRIIPCFDQINLKAKFKMLLLHPKRLTSFSNAAEKSRKDINTSTKPNWVQVEFHKTKKMATFSIAMALVQFTTTGRHTESNVKRVNVQTWADENVIDRMRIDYNNKLASQSFQFFSRFFKLPHPLKKLDILILPDVEFEIEESFGIIFMSQKYVLGIDPLDESWYLKLYETALKICHAVSYQWIGSTVTMSQWQDTWFHQGLNYFLQKECAREIFPEYPKDVLHLNMIESFLDFMRSEELETRVYGEPRAVKKLEAGSWKPKNLPFLG